MITANDTNSIIWPGRLLQKKAWSVTEILAGLIWRKFLKLSDLFIKLLFFVIRGHQEDYLLTHKIAQNTEMKNFHKKVLHLRQTFLIHVLCMINLAKTHIWNNKSVTPICILYVTNTCQDMQPWGIKDMSETLSHKGNFWKDCYFRKNSSEAVVPI